MNAIDLILAKRDGGRLSDEQIDWFIRSYTDGLVVDEQAAALLMAILFRGLDPDELARWTQQMIATGSRADLSGVGKPTVDKHSTGGVGDKVSLVLCPLVAACGVAVPQTAGRGLGHTGGTLDKMETIPGWRSTLTPDEVSDVLRTSGAVINAAGPDLAPADRKLYALRDITGTVESIPLIASSIMSKKIAEGTGALVLDVKVGSGAFMKDEGRARELAETMVGLGRAHDVQTVALLTQMDVPLGRSAGNALEVTESIEVLGGGGPSDLVELTLSLAREMLDLVGLDAVDPADLLADGRAMDAWQAMVRAQGGDPDGDPAARPRGRGRRGPRHGHARPARRHGRRRGGVAARRRPGPQGGRRLRHGGRRVARHGRRSRRGRCCPCWSSTSTIRARLPSALEALDDAIEVSPDPVAPPPMVLGRVT